MTGVGRSVQTLPRSCEEPVHPESEWRITGGEDRRHGSVALMQSSPVARDKVGKARLSVVVCAYTMDRLNDVTAAVDSLRTQQPAPHEVILVIDHNDDLFFALQAYWPDVLVVRSTGATGLSGARNTGVKQATGEIVAFLDDDAVAERGWAQHLVDAYSDETVMGVGGAVKPAWRAGRPEWFPDEFLWVVGCSYVGQPLGRAVVRNAIGANMSFRRSVFEVTGGFDETIGRLGQDAAGCEETEFSIRAHRAVPGGRVVLEPEAVVRHAVTAQRVTREYFRQRCAAEGRSKALVADLVGPDDALASERGYATRTLPAGVMRNLVAVARGDKAAASRAWAIVDGLVITAWCYTKARRRRA
ncbi:MAG: glycosyl transferase family 2 [Frondihabitans sp.]|nr:glycosyl transferase family 2 [Frondihabitans sp.]